ncbi:MAG TPA: HD domain-containing protein [Dehalococcoidia bacterium]|jgi:[protein-PII] uridylyltransferase
MTASALAGFLAVRETALQAAPADPGAGLCAALTDAMDAAVRAAGPADAADLTIVALGGYGRRELCLYSDVDLMLLYDGKLAPTTVERLFYPLWDAGLKLGHAVRSVPEAIAAATDDVETFTSLLDARFVCGATPLYARLQEELNRLGRRTGARVHAALVAAEHDVRRAEPYQLLEIDLKNGRGGLRTLHRLRWLWRIEEMTNPGKAPASADTEITTALNLLLATRNALHAAAGRQQDIWLFDLQAQASAWLGAELDLCATRLYGAVRSIDRRAARVLEDNVARRSVTERTPGRLSSLLRKMPPRAEPVGQDCPTDEPVAPPQHSVLAHAGWLAGQPALPPRLAPARAAEVAAAPGPGWTPADRAGLLALLRAGRRGYEIFDQLDALGWIERALPEWRHVRAAPQHVPFHRHPLDVHLWRTAIEALQLAEGCGDEPWFAEVGRDLGELDDLLLAALLHDIGKGWPGDHAERGAEAAAAFCRRASFPAGFNVTVATAVRHHLLLPNVATRRDITDPRVVEEVAACAGSERTLRILFLLAAADSLATGPGIWTPWKGSLVRSLFAQALAVLEARGGANPLAAGPPELRERILAAAPDEAARRALGLHVDGMAPGYLRTFSPEEILRHVAVAAPPLAEQAARLDVQGEGPVFDLVVALRDRPGLIALVSGVLALHNLSVLGARFFTRADGVALQSLHVIDALGNPVAAERWARVERDVQAALLGRLPLGQRMAEKMHAYRRAGRMREAEVHLVEHGSRPFTVLEVHAADRVGLLYTLASALFELGIDIHLAKIDTQGPDAVDVFYIREAQDQPLRGAERIQQVREALRRAASG